MIQFKCPSCGYEFRVDDSLAGRRAKCKHCGGAIVVPAAEARPAVAVPAAKLPVAPAAAPPIAAQRVAPPTAPVAAIEPPRAEPVVTQQIAERVVYVQAPAPQTVVLTERTSKKWKLGQLVSVLLLVGGAALSFACVGSMFSASGEVSGPAAVTFTLGILCLIAGLVGYIFARVGAWWHHG